MSPDAHAASSNAPTRERRSPILIGVGLALVAVLLLANGWIDFVNLRTMRDAGRQERTVQEMLQVSSDLSATLSAVESAQRGYVATGEASFLGGYAAARGRALQSLDRLGALAADRAPVSQRWQSLGPKVHERLRFADENIALRREQGFDAARQFLAAGAGQQLTDAIRAELTALGATQHDLLDVQRRASEHAYGVAVVSTTSATLLGLLLLGATGWLTRRDERHRQRDQALLRQSEERLRNFVRNLPVAVAMVDTQMRYLAASERWSLQRGLGARDLTGASHYELLPDLDERWKAVHRRCLTGAVEGGDEDELVAPNGAIEWVRWEVRPWRKLDGEVGGLILYFDVITARRKVETALRESQARLAAMVDSAMDAIVSVDGEQRIVLFNAAAERMFGCNAAEVLGQPVDRFIPLHARALHAEHLRRFASGDGAARSMEVPRALSGVRADGVEFPLEASISNVEIAGHKVLTAILRDISERRRAEDALKRSEERLRQAVAVAGLGLFDHDHRRDEVHLSPQLRDTLDIEAGDSSSLERIIQCIHPEDRARIAAAIARAADPAGDGTFASEHRILRRDGVLRWVSARARTTFDGEGSQRRPVRTIGAVVDITDRVEAQAEVDRLQQRYRAIVDLSPNAIVLTEGGRIALVNQACLELFGAEQPSQVLGRDWTDFVRSDRSASQAVDFSSGERTVRRHARIVRLDGVEREVEISAADVPDHGEYAVQFVVSDVTTRNRNARLLAQSREELRRLSANLIQVREEERRRIARELHDELGQRLSAIKMHIVTLMAAPVAEADTGHRLAETVGMVNELVTSVRRIAADLRPAMLDDLGLHAAIDWLAAESSTRSGLHVTVRCDADCDRVDDAAKTAVYRFVQEALTNVQRHAQAGQVDIDLRCDKRKLVACVADDGVGIAHAATRKPGSYGLIGMRERARQLGGTLTIDRRAEGGSRIEMHIPVDGIRLPSASTTPGDL